MDASDGHHDTVSSKAASSTTTWGTQKASQSLPQFPVVATAVAATAPMDKFCFSSDDDDSDNDSFAAQCRAFQARRRKRARPAHSIPTTTKGGAAAGTTTATSNSSNGKDDDSDDDDNDTGINPIIRHTEKPQKKAKEGTQPQTKKRRAAQKLERDKQERDKQAAREQRQQARVAKQQAAQAAKQQKQRERQISHQARGRYANQEIAILLEPAILLRDDNDASHPWKVRETLEVSGFTHVHAYPSGLSCNAIQFIRQEYLQGGATQAVQDLLQKGPPPGNGASVLYEHLNVLAVIVDGPTMIDLMIEGDDTNDDDDTATSRRGCSNNDDDDDYPLLEQWLFGLVAGWRAAWNKTAADRPRIILLLYQVQDHVDRLWVRYKKNKRRGPTPPNTEQLHDAILWMLIQFQVESIHCHTPEDVGHEVYKMTRLLAETPYARQATDLQTIAKLPAHVSDMAPSLDRARDTWIRQLQQVPRLSADMAANVAQHYPTALSLWNVYQDDTIPEHEKQALLADLFGRSSSQFKLSNHVYRALTSDNPAEILS